jgi:uncharacterized membrane protein
MDTTHLHLLLNHFPTVGFIIGIGLFVIALFSRSEDLKRGSLVVLVGIALVSIATYTTGNAAQGAVCVAADEDPCQDPTVSKAMIEEHETAAFLALAFIQLTGAVAWLGLWSYRRRPRLSPAVSGAVLLLSVAAFALVARAANIGGEIRHFEIRAADLEEAIFDPAVRPWARHVGNYVRDTQWAWIAAETIHFVGLTLLMGTVLLVNLRMLGLLKNVSFAAVDRLLPWGMLGFGMNIVTGMLFFVAFQSQYIDNAAFHLKVLLIILAGVNTLFFCFDPAWQLKPGDRAPFISKVVATSATVLWIGVMFYGAMLPFLGNAF